MSATEIALRLKTVPTENLDLLRAQDPDNSLQHKCWRVFKFALLIGLGGASLGILLCCIFSGAIFLPFLSVGAVIALGAGCLCITALSILGFYKMIRAEFSPTYFQELTQLAPRLSSSPEGQQVLQERVWVEDRIVLGDSSAMQERVKLEKQGLAVQPVNSPEKLQNRLLPDLELRELPFEVTEKIVVDYLDYGDRTRLLRVNKNFAQMSAAQYRTVLRDFQFHVNAIGRGFPPGLCELFFRYYKPIDAIERVESGVDLKKSDIYQCPHRVFHDNTAIRIRFQNTENGGYLPAKKVHYCCFLSPTRVIWRALFVVGERRNSSLNKFLEAQTRKPGVTVTKDPLPLFLKKLLTGTHPDFELPTRPFRLAQNLRIELAEGERKAN